MDNIVVPCFFLTHSVYRIGIFYGKVVSFWGRSPQTTTGASPLDTTGGFRPPHPLNFAPPEIIPGYATGVTT